MHSSSLALNENRIPAYSGPASGAPEPMLQLLSRLWLAAGARTGSAQPASGGAATAQPGSSGQGSSQWSGQGGPPGGGDPQQMLNRAPAVQLADLKKGDAVMLVATDGTTDFTAITLLAGVEPLLEAPAASQALLNNWSMGSGAPDAGMAQ